MNDKIFHATTGILFGIIALLHAVRLLRGWEVHIADVLIPLWISVPALLISGYLAIRAFQITRSR